MDPNQPRKLTSVSAACPAGYSIIGGGAAVTNTNENDIWVVQSSRPFKADGELFETDVWIARFVTADGENFEGDHSLRADAICALLN